MVKCDKTWIEGHDMGTGEHHDAALIEEKSTHRSVSVDDDIFDTDEFRAYAADKLQTLLGWKHLVKYSGMPEEWMQQLLMSGIARVSVEAMREYPKERILEP